MQDGREPVTRRSERERVGGETLVWAWARLALAVVCVAVLIAARWRHEHRAARRMYYARRIAEGEIRVWPARDSLGLRAGAGASGWLARLPVPSHPLYWLGLTAAAALASHAIAALIAVR